MTLKKDKNERYHLFDTVRGLCILGVVIYHALFDCIYVFGLLAVSTEIMQAVLYVRDFGCLLFVLLAGMCEHFGKAKYKRAVGLLGIGTAISLISYLLMPQNVVVFGVLSFMGVASLFLQPLKRLLKNAIPLPCFVGAVALFLLFFNAAYGTFGLYGMTFGKIPSVLYANSLTAILGFPPNGFASSDYFQLVPWFFAYLAGYFLFPLLQFQKALEVLMLSNT